VLLAIASASIIRSTVRDMASPLVQLVWISTKQTRGHSRDSRPVAPVGRGSRP
jgi:hypothetical protein